MCIHLSRCALDEDAAAAHEADAVGLVRLLHEVRRHHHRRPPRRALRQERPGRSLDGVSLLVGLLSS